MDFIDLAEFGDNNTAGVDMTPEMVMAIETLTSRLAGARTGNGNLKALEGTPYFWGFRGSAKASGAGCAGLLHYLQSNFGQSDRSVAEGLYALGLPLRRDDKVTSPTGGIDWVRTIARCLASNGIHWGALSWAFADGVNKRRPVLYMSKSRGWAVDLDGHARRKGVLEEHPVHLPHQVEEFKGRLHSGLAAFHVHRGAASVGFADPNDTTETVDEPSNSGLDPELLAKLLKLAESLGIK